jgi:hypothetical protein
MAVAEGSVSAILKSGDVTRTIEWYRRMGFEIRGVFPESGEPTWCEVARDGVILQFLGGDTPWPGHPRSRGRSISAPRAWMRCTSRSRITQLRHGDPKYASGVPANLACKIPTGSS